MPLAPPNTTTPEEDGLDACAAPLLPEPAATPVAPDACKASERKDRFPSPLTPPPHHAHTATHRKRGPASRYDGRSGIALAEATLSHADGQGQKGQGKREQVADIAAGKAARHSFSGRGDRSSQEAGRSTKSEVTSRPSALGGREFHDTGGGGGKHPGGCGEVKEG